MYTRYFLPGQKILLRAVRTDQDAPRIEAVTTRMVTFDAGRFELALNHPWQADEPFFTSQDQEAEIISECYGLGLRSTVSFRGLHHGKLIRLHANNDLSLFPLRPKPRIDTHIGLQHFSARTGLSTFYRKWTQQIDKLKNISSALNAPLLPIGEVNLSSTGMRAVLNNPVANHDLCLIMLELHPDEKPICTLAEVVWTSLLENPQRRLAGLQFLNILHNDRERIEQFIKTDQAFSRKASFAEKA